MCAQLRTFCPKESAVLKSLFTFTFIRDTHWREDLANSINHRNPFNPVIFNSHFFLIRMQENYSSLITLRLKRLRSVCLCVCVNARPHCSALLPFKGVIFVFFGSNFFCLDVSHKILEKGWRKEKGKFNNPTNESTAFECQTIRVM